jgi:uncharacterized protein YacL
MVLFILRAAFIVLVVAVATLFVLQFQHQAVLHDQPAPGFWPTVGMMAIIIGAGLMVIIADVATKKKRLVALSGVFMGLLAGLLVAYILSFVVDLVGFLLADQISAKTLPALLKGVKLFIGLITCYMGVALVLQTKDDFRFVIPYIEFSKQVRGPRPVLLDTSVIIDGRILDIAQTRFLSGRLIVPRFVLDELQNVADSADKLRRARGRRGLEILQKLQKDPTIEVDIADIEAEGAGVDQKLVEAGEQLKARVMTNDFNLAKICELRNVQVMNLNELAGAMRPVVLPGEVMRVKVIREGESAGQAVGFLDDGTMVVVEKAAQSLGKEVSVVVTSSLQTSAGRMIFGRLDHSDDHGSGNEPGRKSEAG